MTNDKISMTKLIQMTNNKIQNKKFDLEDRTLKFSKDCIDLCRLFARDAINAELINQLVRAAGSVGANYREANDATTKKDFFYRIGVCRRESKECKYWLELLLHSNPKIPDKIEPLIDEALQLARIFASIARDNG